MTANYAVNIKKDIIYLFVTSLAEDAWLAANTLSGWN